MMSPMRPGIVHAMGQVRVIHPSDGKALPLVGEVDFDVLTCLCSLCEGVCE